MCYGSMNVGSSSSDHRAIHPTPGYRPGLKRGKVKTREIKDWKDESGSQIQGCFECTDWNVFKDSASDIDELTDTILLY